MGNSIGGGRKRAKIMKIDGEIFKVKVPATAMDVLKDYPAGYVLLRSDAVKKYGIRAPELLPEDEIKPGKIYFLVEIPKFPEPRRARAVGRVNSAEERLKGLMLRQKPDPEHGSGPEPVRVKIRVPKARIQKLMEESKDEAEVAERIVHLCLQNCSNGQGRN